jgi:hypothetical protein
MTKKPDKQPDIVERLRAENADPRFWRRMYGRSGHSSDDCQIASAYNAAFAHWLIRRGPHEASRIYWQYDWHGGRVAAHSAGAGTAGDWVPQRRIARRLRAHDGRVSS